MSCSKSMVLGYWDIRGVSVLPTAQPLGRGDGRRGAGGSGQRPPRKRCPRSPAAPRDPSPAESPSSPWDPGRRREAEHGQPPGRWRGGSGGRRLNDSRAGRGLGSPGGTLAGGMGVGRGLRRRPPGCPPPHPQLAHAIRLLLEFTGTRYEEKRYTCGGGKARPSPGRHRSQPRARGAPSAGSAHLQLGSLRPPRPHPPPARPQR